jgi:hypothetical protein
VAGAMYAGILRVHPFADGNHRTGLDRARRSTRGRDPRGRPRVG